MDRRAALGLHNSVAPRPSQTDVLGRAGLGRERVPRSGAGGGGGRRAEEAAFGCGARGELVSLTPDARRAIDEVPLSACSRVSVHAYDLLRDDAITYSTRQNPQRGTYESYDDAAPGVPDTRMQWRSTAPQALVAFNVSSRTLRRIEEPQRTLRRGLLGDREPTRTRRARWNARIAPYAHGRSASSGSGSAGLCRDGRSVRRRADRRKGWYAAMLRRGVREGSLWGRCLASLLGRRASPRPVTNTSYLLGDAESPWLACDKPTSLGRGGIRFRLIRLLKSHAAQGPGNRGGEAGATRRVFPA